MRVLLLLLLVCASPASAEIYTWKQGGVAHYTNQPDTIPPRYRSKAKVLAIPGEPKNEQRSGLPGQAQVAPSPSSLPMPPPPPPAVVMPQAPVKQEIKTRSERRGRKSSEDD